VNKPPSLIACLSMLATSACLAADENRYLDLSLEELLNVPVNIASRKALSQRESPGILTVIQGEEIRRSGARNLEDVLRQVSGFGLRLIGSNVLGLGVRGHIGSDGRVLMLVDGIEVNEHRFGTAQFGQGFPVESIQRIEIVRGSGLAMYGGTAELGVINIITRSATDLDGVHVGAGIGVAEGGRSREYGSLMAGKAGDTVQLSAAIHSGRELRSNRTFYGQNGTSYDMSESDDIRPEYVNLGLTAGDFKLRYLRDSSSLDSRYAGGTIQPAAWKIGQDAQSMLMQYRFRANDRLTLSPSLLFQEQTPRETTTHDGVTQSKTSVRRTQAKLGATWDAGELWHLAGGLEYLNEHYDGVVRPFPLRKLAFEQLNVGSAYGEALYRANWGDLTLNARLDDHEQAGKLWSERVGYTKILDRWHVKLMASNAERAPSVEDYSSGTKERLTEKVKTLEFETGYRLDADSQLTLNLFDIETRDTLILQNHQTVQTQGLETVYQVRKNWGQANLSWSWYRPHNTDTLLVLPLDAQGSPTDNSHLAFPSQKLAASLSYRINNRISLTPTLTWLGSYWGYDVPQASPGTGTLKEFPSAALLDIALHWKDAGLRNLDLTFGVYNCFDKSIAFLAPFKTSTPSTPDVGREAVLSMQYKF
jgi:outer membrane cobalamin receptor